MIYRILPPTTFKPFKHLLALVAFLCLSTISLFAQKTVNFTLAASIDNAAAGVNSGDLFIYKLNYQCSSFDTSGRNVVATIVLPDKVVPFSTSPFSSSVSFDNSQVASVTYNAATKTITVTYVDPLPAGSSGQLQIRMKYENGTTPNGYAPDIITTIDASNNLNPDNSTGPFASNIVTIPAIASNKYTIGKVVDAGGAIDDITIFKLNISASGASSGALNLQSPVVVDTLPPGVVFDKATKFSGSNAPVYNPVDRTVTWTWPSNFTTNYSGSAYISVKYTSPTYAIGANACNSATLSGNIPGLPIGTNEPTSKSGSVCFNIESPSAEIICTGGGITAATANWLNKHILAGTNGNTFNVGWANNGNTEVDTVRLTYNVDKSIDMNVISVRPVYDGFDSVTQAKIEVWYATNLNGFTALGTFYSLDIANGTTPVNHTVSLPSGEYITQVKFVISGNLPIGGYQSLSYSGNARTTALGAKDGTPIVEGITYKPSTPGDDGTVVNNISTGSFTYKGVTNNYSNCGGVAEILRPQPVFNTLSKTIISGTSSVRASDTIRYQFQAQLGGNVNATNVVISDTLDSRLTYIAGSSTLEIDAASSPITPVVNGNILTYNLGNLVVGKTYRIKFSAVVNPGTAPGTIPNQMVVGSDNALLTGKTNVRNATVISAVALRAYKGQSGCDPNIVYYPTVALAQEGGPVNYKITLRNLGNVPAKDLVLVDVFPFIGDTRGSQWYANLAAPVSINDPLSTVHYTTTANPCYSSDFTSTGNPPGCNTPSWSTTPPVDITKVTAIKITRSADIPVFDSIVLTWPMRAPIGVPVGLVMNNSIIYQMSRADNGDRLLPAIPNKVGMMTNCTPVLGSIGNYVWVDSNRNGLNDEPASFGLNGVKIYLYGAGPNGVIGGGDDVLIDSTITASDWSGKKGYYKFVEVPSGNYYVKFPTDYDQYVITPTYSHFPKVDNNSSANPANGLSELITINAAGTGQDKDNTTIDAGYYPTGTLGNYVWHDVNGDGLRNEPIATAGINGVTVHLQKDDGTGNFVFVQSMQTKNDANGNPGYYNFIIPESGNYRVLFPETLADGKKLTKQTATVATDNNSDANITTGLSPVVVMNVFGSGVAKNNPTIDAGYLTCVATTFTYGNNPYCVADTLATPVLTGLSGGVFSSLPGLIINPTTGVVDVDSSTAGASYPVTYTYGTGGCATTATAWIGIYDCGVSSGGSGGVESKGLGDIITKRSYQQAKDNKNGPINYSTLPIFDAPVQQTGVFGAGNGIEVGTLDANSTTSLRFILPATLNNYVPYATSPVDLTGFTNATEILSIDFTQNKFAKAVAFGTKTQGKVYEHTKPICDRLKGAQLLSVDVFTINGITFNRYQLKGSNGNVEFASSFSIGTKFGRNSYTFQSNWLMNDYVSDETMYNVQLWAVSPELVEAMAKDIVQKLTQVAPVQALTVKVVPKTYIIGGARELGNVSLSLQNNTNITSGYFEVREKANENAPLVTRRVPFSVTANGKSSVSIPVADHFESNIDMYINNKMEDAVYMSDGAWSIDYNRSKTLVKSFGINNDAERTYTTDEFPLFRNVEVRATSSDYVTLTKVIRGGAVATNLTDYKALRFTANGGYNLRITLVKNSISEWNKQYSYLLPLNSGEKEYFVNFADFKSAGTNDKIDPSDVTMIVMSIEVGNGRQNEIATNIKRVGFVKQSIASSTDNEQLEINLYPNPASGRFNCVFKSDKEQVVFVRVIEVSTGKEVMSKQVAAIKGNNIVPIEMANRNTKLGNYIIAVGNNDVQYKRKAIIIK